GGGGGGACPGPASTRTSGSPRGPPPSFARCRGSIPATRPRRPRCAISGLRAAEGREILGRSQGVRMAVKSDKWIRRMALEHRMIEPFSEKQVRDGVVSYGVSSYGYDGRIPPAFRLFP